MSNKKTRLRLFQRNTRKGNLYTNQKMRQLFFCIGAVVALLFVLQMLTDPTSACGMVGSGLTMAAMIPLVNIDDVSDRETHGSAISYFVWLYHVSIIDKSQAFPQPAENSREVTAIPLVTGKKPIYFEAHDIPTLVSTTEKGDITTTGENTFVIILGGDRDAIKNFIEGYSGGKFVLVYKHVKESGYHILGELDRPMILSSTEVKDDKDGRYATLTFTRQSVDLPLIYKGNPTTDGESDEEGDAESDTHEG